MSGKGRRGKEQGRVTFPQQGDEEGAEEEEQQQRRRRGWRGVNGGLEPAQLQPPRAVKTQREPYGCYPPSPLPCTG